MKAEKALKAERRSDGVATGRASLRVAGLPDLTQVHSLLANIAGSSS